MDLATYMAAGAMYVVGALGLPTWSLRAVAAGLCLAFALVHGFLFGRLTSTRRATLYFLLQSALLVGLLALRARVDSAFGFLFFILTIEAALVLPQRPAAAWVIAFFLLTSLINYMFRGTDSLVEILFNVPIYVLCAMVGQTLRRTELARQSNQALLDDLRAAQQQLRELAVVEERNRLAREMHDSLGHRLTVAVVQLEGAQRLIAIDADRASRMIGAMRDEMKEALAELRGTVTALRAPAEAELPLAAALARLAEAFAQSTGLATHFTAPAPLPPLPEAYRLEFYRAAQEALTNVQRHAAARHIWLRLEASEQEICLAVDDDGRGLPEGDGLAAGSGLRGLRERAAALRGQLQVSNRLGGGVGLRFSAPCPEAGE